jgi:hypothetical protein
MSVYFAKVLEMQLSPYCQVLVLNFDYTPLNIVAGRRAIVLLLKQRAQKVSDTVIRLLKYIRVPLSRAAREKPTKSAIYRRDNHCCQYCGSTRNLTIDHLIPRCRGGLDTWENLVIACSKCNTEKGDKPLQNTRLRLRKKPKPPLSRVMETVQRSTDSEWSQYGFF